MTHPYVTELLRQIAADEKRLARIGDPQSREQALLLFSIERDIKERRRRIALLLQEQAS
jgi:hypothetical protein